MADKGRSAKPGPWAACLASVHLDPQSQLLLASPTSQCLSGFFLPSCFPSGICWLNQPPPQERCMCVCSQHGASSGKIEDSTALTRPSNRFIKCYLCPRGFPAGSVVKKPPAKAGDAGSTPGSGRSPGEGNGNPLQCSLPGDFHGGLQATGSQRAEHSCGTEQ